MKKTWFDINRSTIIFTAVQKLLQTQLFGDLNSSDYNRLTEIVDTFKEQADNNVIATAEDLGFESEISYAATAEAVQLYDAETIQGMIDSASVKHTVDLNAVTSQGGFITHALREFETTLESAFPKGCTSPRFIIASPLVISLMQGGFKSTLHPSCENSFKGPNNTLLIGTTMGADVYSYIFSPEVSDVVIVGYGCPDIDDVAYTTITINNTGF